MRAQLKSALGALQPSRRASGATLLIYHRVGGGSSDELDLSPASFQCQVAALAGHEVVSLDAALDALDADDDRPRFVLTFDDGFEDIYHHAWPVLRAYGMPFTIYLATAYMGSIMRWEGSTARGPAGRGLTWSQLEEMVASGLCTVGNHTHSHARPEVLTPAELDRCTALIEDRLSVTPRHFTYPWGISVPGMEAELRLRFRSASTGELGRNLPDVDRMRLRRVPVRRTDPERFFIAKLSGGLGPERAYAAIVSAAKAMRRAG